MFIDKIKEIIKQTKCQKGFKCLSDRDDNLCKLDYFKPIDYHGTIDIFECLDDLWLDCEFRDPFLDRHLCKCPVRIELFKQSLEKGR